MTKENVLPIDNYSDKLSEKGLWDPDLIVAVSHVIGSGAIGTKQTITSDNFHYLCWLNASGAEEVAIEISNDGAFLLINNDRYRGHLERIALEGIAASFSLQLGGFEDPKKEI